MAVKRLTKEDFNYVYKKAPRLCVDLVVFSEKGILFTKRAIPPFKGYWHFPGGSVYFGEKIQGAIKRVAAQELDVRVEVIKLLDYMEIVRTPQDRHDVGMEFLVRQVGGEIKLNYQATEARFFKEVPKKVIKEHWRVALKALEETKNS